MVTSLDWIKKYVPGLSCTDQEYFDKMTMSGTKVEGWKRLDHNLEKIVVGRVEEITKHPDADHLLVCKVNIGSEMLQICTSAANLKVGDVVPVCTDGGRVAGGHDGGPMLENGIKIKAGKMRGVDSQGMMCGIEELGSSRNLYPEAPENGIYVFPKDKEPELGSDAVEALGMHDTVFDYEITSNRVDCYSMIGIAREAAATFDKPFTPPVVTVKENPAVKTADLIKVTIEAPDLCSRYIARVCTDVKIAPSPEWMQKCLRNSGIRPINNLVDITNYVMLEYGQPMHAYDYDTLAGAEIRVRRAKDGETFTTLDDQERKLDHDVLMICDGEKEVGLAGIMGGENSMITDHVKTVLFEAATFDGTNIRKSSKRIGLRTDASGIFEKGLDPRNAEEAINRACQLMVELGCGTPAEGMVDVKQPIPDLRRIKFEPEKINAYLGTDLSAEEMLTIFRKEQLGYDEETKEIVVPSFRQDLKQMCDMAEEVARFHGYDNIPSTLPKSSSTRGGITPMMRLQNKAAEIMLSYGYSQSETFSFESPKVFDTLRLPQDAPERKAIRISNPLGDDFSIMRTMTLNGLLTSLGTNFARRNKDVKLYEIGKVYLPKGELPITDYPDEHYMLSFGFYGDGDFFTLKGALEDVLDAEGLKKKRVYNADAKRPYLHPGRQANVFYEDELIGFLGEVHPDVAKTYGITDRVYVAVVNLAKILAKASFAHHYSGIANYPSMSRDISMLVPKNVTAGEIEAVIEQRGGKILESYRLFDIYEGAQVGLGFKSMAYSLTFRHKDRTLEAEEVDKAMKKILNGLKDLGIELRA
ncbi:MAG TPA: phenylalanine--tRNA ligase subunit beta [Lachnospiraceae bacterium]|nr:phenylalanine--tRNA ligase subunit beta [Lachnospiraceae bacterium]